jgi:hypothetical protein
VFLEMLAAGLEPAQAAFPEQLGRTLRREIGLRRQLGLDSLQASEQGFHRGARRGRRSPSSRSKKPRIDWIMFTSSVRALKPILSIRQYSRHSCSSVNSRALLGRNLIASFFNRR